MITISVCMIVKNEEKQLRACLDSLKPIADEIIICDTGSTDGTKAIAAEYTDRIYDFPWIDDFAAARNFVFSKATMEYIYTA
ncbi:MAG: glycosyltransferase, partial [Ruminiclostridium sp.]|nr:glycosyltransferase [Ruminiclostridium sp.]